MREHPAQSLEDRVSATVSLTRKRIIELLEALSAKLGADPELAAQGVVGELYLVGGAVMSLVLRSRPATNDLDGYFVPSTTIRKAAAAVAIEHDLPPTWLNDAVKGLLGRGGTHAPFLELPHLRVFTATPEYLLAMKCMALRLGPEFHDEADVRYLLRYLNLERPAQALEVVTRFFPRERIPQKTLYALDELLTRP